MQHGASGFIRVIVLAACSLLASLAQTPARAQTTSTEAPRLAAHCEGLLRENLMLVPDAPTHIYSAKLIEAAADGKPAYCEVEGNIAPEVGILMWLPAQAWNGKFLEVGCGGFCGMFTFIANCDDPLRKGYACITTDMGHKGKEAEGMEWAYNNPQAVIDFAYRATHVTALAGKAIVEKFYGQKPKVSYFSGCSCGGRQALVEAERFPWDFNGIIVGAPGMYYEEVALTAARKVRLLKDHDGQPLFNAASIQFIANAIITKCDMNDGLKDGQIGDPRLCKFDPHEYICAAGAKSNCLSREQADAAAAFYTEQRSASGDRVGEPAFMPGWEASFFGLAVNTPVTERTFYEDFFKYMALVPNPGPAWKFEDFDINSDYKRLGMIQSLLAADNPDLHRFKEAGGKLIFYHGWNDAGISPLTSIEFYKAIEKTMGGRAATQSFLRLFMVPDMDHCKIGAGAWAIDYLAYLEKWTEKGEAPDLMIGGHPTGDPMASHLDPAAMSFTRPVFPYPLRAQYKGTGDPNRASSFQAVNSETR